jgi:hypothetical protein
MDGRQGLIEFLRSRQGLSFLRIVIGFDLLNQRLFLLKNVLGSIRCGPMIGSLCRRRRFIPVKVTRRRSEQEAGSFASVRVGFTDRTIRATAVMIIIIIHLLGLAPAGYLAVPDNGA